jgi:hypothetical protein
VFVEVCVNDTNWLHTKYKSPTNRFLYEPKENILLSKIIKQIFATNIQNTRHLYTSYIVAHKKKSKISIIQGQVIADKNFKIAIIHKTNTKQITANKNLA